MPRVALVAVSECFIALWRPHAMCSRERKSVALVSNRCPVLARRLSFPLMTRAATPGDPVMEPPFLYRDTRGPAGLTNCLGASPREGQHCFWILLSYQNAGNYVAETCTKARFRSMLRLLCPRALKRVARLRLCRVVYTGHVSFARRPKCKSSPFCFSFVLCALAFVPSDILWNANGMLVLFSAASHRDSAQWIVNHGSSNRPHGLLFVPLVN